MVPADIILFLDNYRDAFNALDGHRVAAACAAPMMIHSKGAHGLLGTQTAIVANMEALCAQYRTSGFARTDYVMVQGYAQGADFYWVDLCWTIHRPNGAPRPSESFNTSYQLTKTDDGWRVLTITAYSEARFWAEHTSLKAETHV
jgi:hypothetical protein